MSASWGRREYLRRVLPVVVSAGVLGALLWSVDLRQVAAAVTPRVALVMLPALLAYGAITLGLESLSILRLLRAPPDDFGAWTAARIKCASYLLAIVHYALGLGALVVLLRRRAGLALGEAASLVVLISSADLLLVLTLAALGSAMVETGAPGVRIGMLVLAIGGFFGGLALLRAPFSLGPLDRLRDLSMLAGLRTIRLARLAELLALRGVFALCFVAICGACFAAFEVYPPWPELVAGVLLVALVSALPIAVAGLGTSQLAVVAIFGEYASREHLIALSLVLSAGLIALRSGMGLVFAREFTREALREQRSAEA